MLAIISPPASTSKIESMRIVTSLPEEVERVILPELPKISTVTSSNPREVVVGRGVGAGTGTEVGDGTGTEVGDGTGADVGAVGRSVGAGTGTEVGAGFGAGTGTAEGSGTGTGVRVWAAARPKPRTRNARRIICVGLCSSAALASS